MNDLGELAGRVQASSFTELFGTGDDARKQYRRLLATTHPDRWPHQRSLATETFHAINTLWAAGHTPETLATRKRTYTLSGKQLRGDIANVQRCTWEEDGTTQHGMVKLVRNPKNNDLVENEASTLKVLAATEDKWQAYLPGLAETLRHQDESGRERAGLVYQLPAGTWSLAEIQERRPGGLDPRDAAWMWRRLLVALGVAARADHVHGAVLPENVLVVPEAHGLVLINWHLAVPIGEKVPAAVGKYRDWYPPEILEQRAAGPATDIAMGSRLMREMMGARTPPQLDAFVQGCTLPSVPSRPQDPWGLLGELDELLERLYGPKKFRPFQP